MEYFINQGSWTPTDKWKGPDWRKDNYSEVAGEENVCGSGLRLFERKPSSKEGHGFLIEACFNCDSVHIFWADDPPSILQAVEFCNKLAKLSHAKPDWLEDFLTYRYRFEGKWQTGYIEDVGQLLDKVYDKLSTQAGWL